MTITKNCYLVMNEYKFGRRGSLLGMLFLVEGNEQIFS